MNINRYNESYMSILRAMRALNRSQKKPVPVAISPNGHWAVALFEDFTLAYVFFIGDQKQTRPISINFVVPLFDAPIPGKEISLAISDTGSFVVSHEESAAVYLYHSAKQFKQRRVLIPFETKGCRSVSIGSNSDTFTVYVGNQNNIHRFEIANDHQNVIYDDALQINFPNIDKRFISEIAVSKNHETFSVACEDRMAIFYLLAGKCDVVEFSNGSDESIFIDQLWYDDKDQIVAETKHKSKQKNATRYIYSQKDDQRHHLVGTEKRLKYGTHS